MNQNAQKSLSEQIYDELILLIQECPEFDKNTLLQIKQLAENREFKKATKVTSAIQVKPETMP